MRSADAEPNIGETCSATIVIGFTASRTDPLIMICVFFSATLRRESESQAAWLPQLPSKTRSYFQVAQTIRASRLARATVALL